MYNNLKPREIKLYKFIRKSTLDNGYQPSIREMCTHFGYSSPNSVAEILTTLRAKGYIETTGQSRAIKFLK